MSPDADLAALPLLPRDAEGPVFREPWEARAFALALRLHEAGAFTWPEWAAVLAEEIARARAEGDPDLGTTYYRHWLAALERITAEKDLVAPDALAREASAIAAAPAGPGHDDHDHDDHDHP